jgi:hypothetical protein
LRVSVDRDHPDRSIRDHLDRSIVITEIGILIADIGVVITGIGPRDHPAGQASSDGRVAGA